MIYYKIHIWRIYSFKHWESHIISTYHLATDSKIRHLPQHIIDPQIHKEKYLFIIPYRKCTLREQISILLSYPNKLSPEHIKWKLAPDFSSKHCKSTLNNFTHDLYYTLIPHSGVHFTLKRSLSAPVYVVREKVQWYFLWKNTPERS